MIIRYKEGIRIIPLLQVKSVVYQDLFKTACVLASVGRLFSFSIVDADHKKLPLQSDKKASEKLGMKGWNISPNTIYKIQTTHYLIIICINTYCMYKDFWILALYMIDDMVSSDFRSWFCNCICEHIFLVSAAPPLSLRKQVPALSFRCQASW